jgi:hypothetical protein
MRHVTLATLIAIAAPAAAQAPQAATTVTLAEQAKVTAAPDTAEIGTGVVTTAPSAADALAANARRMAAVVTALRRAGVAERDIQTSGIRLEPQYRYAQDQPPQLTGYQANNRVSVRIRDIAGTGRLLDQLVAQGANQIDGPNFTIAEPAPLLDQARQSAVATLRRRAELYARAMGLQVARIVSVEEDSAVRDPRPVPMMATMARAEKADTPVAPGEVELSVNVRMVFELR